MAATALLSYELGMENPCVTCTLYCHMCLTTYVTKRSRLSYSVCPLWYPSWWIKWINTLPKGCLLSMLETTEKECQVLVAELQMVSINWWLLRLRLYLEASTGTTCFYLASTRKMSSICRGWSSLREILVSVLCPFIFCWLIVIISALQGWFL